MSEAELIQAMHEERAPDLEYTPVLDRLPELVRPADLAALRADLKTQQEINRLLRFENETLDANLALERGENDRLRLINERVGNEVITYGLANDDLRGRIAELDAQLAAVPVGALLRYCEHAEPRGYPGAVSDLRAISKWAEQQSEAQP